MGCLDITLFSLKWLKPVNKLTLLTKKRIER